MPDQKFHPNWGVIIGASNAGTDLRGHQGQTDIEYIAVRLEEWFYWTYENESQPIRLS